MNEVTQDDIKELNLLLDKACEHTYKGNLFWNESEGDYIAWRTRVKTFLGKVLPSGSPDLERIKNHQKTGCLDLPFNEYAEMLNGVNQYFIDHNEEK